MQKTLLLFCLSLCFVLSGSAQNQLPKGGICAHRGAMDTFPENTVSAFEEAVRLKVQMIEMDVRFTKDKKLVILHDETVDRTTNGKGRIDEMTWEEVKKLDAGSWKSPEFSHEKIPTFTEVLSLIPEDIWINVHLKGGEELGTRVAEVVIKQNKQHQAFLACGNEAAKGAQKISNEIMICNMDRQNKTEDYVAHTIEEGSEFIQLYKVPINADIINYTKPLKAKGVKINYCCTDDPEEIRKLFDYGVDFILVNKPGTALKSLE